MKDGDRTASLINYYSDVIMGAMASQITSVSIICSTVSSGADQRKHQSSPSLAFVRGIHRWPVNSPHKGPVTRKMFPFDDVIIIKPLTLWRLHKMVDILQATFSMFNQWKLSFQFVIQWGLFFLQVKIDNKLAFTDSGNDLALDRHQAIA